MWKILNKCIPNPNITFRTPSRLGIQAVIPGLNMRARAANRTLYDESFFVRGPSLWNVLPNDLTTIQTLSKFKASLDALLNILIDCPPITGCIRAHDNSLPEVLSLRRMNQGQ